MQNRPYTYLFWIQYLGFRYHGWQKQPDLKTVQGRIEKSAKFVLGHEDFMTLGASRTDTGVSCSKGAFEMFTIEPLDLEIFVRELNSYLPDDIRIIRGQAVALNFNVIQDVSAKEYRYYFACGEKFHPFAAPHLIHVKAELDINVMKIGAQLFVGKHDFRRFCAKNKLTGNFVREIFESELEPVPTFGGGFIPENIFCFRVKGNGFLMHQVRVMMGALLDLGMGKIGLKDIRDALRSEETTALSSKAAAQGLVLEEVLFDFT